MKAYLLCFTAFAVFAAEPEALVRQLASYDFGGDPTAVRALELVAYRAAATGQSRVIEGLLIAGLDSARTVAGKDALCRDLAIVGSDMAVPKLAAMLLDPSTAEMARNALESIPGDGSVAALRDALPHSKPPVQTGIVVSLGRRKDAAAVAAIRPLLASEDARTVAAAANALARIGTKEARGAVSGVTLLEIAERSNPETASELYRRLNGPEQSETVRLAALEGLARVDPTLAAPLLRAAVKSDSSRIEGVAIRALVRIEGAGLAKDLPGMSDRAAVRLISAIADLGSSGALPVLREAAASDREPVRIAALNGLVKLGSAPDVAMLATRAATAIGDEQTAARTALVGIGGNAADAAILQAIPIAEAKVKVELIRAAGERGIPAAPSVLLATASDPNRAVRTTSIRALRETADAPHVPALLELLKKAADSDRRELERTTAAAIRRSPGSPVRDVLTAYDSADSTLRISLLNVLSAVGNPDALPLIHQALQDPSTEISRGALNGLAGWPTPQPMDDLLALARVATDPAQRTLSLRGYLQLVQLPSNRTASETARLLKTAMALATRPDEKKSILASAQRLACTESLELAREALKDASVAAEAKAAVTMLERDLAYVRK
jgi:HEAT repeat protein